MNKPNYGNWIPKTLMYCLWGGTAALGALWLLFTFLHPVPILSPLLFLITLLAAFMAFYMQACRHAFSFSGRGVMGCIHKTLLSYLSWNGQGTLLDIGCGSGALSILCVKIWPTARITGIDYWGKEWNYAKEQCETNARIEQVSPITFCQGDAAALPFPDESFDAAVSNFVFHEVRTQPDKRQVVREEIHYLPHTENMDGIPGYVKAPWLLSGLGILYGIK